MDQNDKRNETDEITGPSTPKAEETNQPPAASDQGDGHGTSAGETQKQAEEVEA